MATYDNPRTGVVHWVANMKGRSPVRTACNHLRPILPSWNWKYCDRVGEPADVTCCKCRETAAWLDALATAGEKGEIQEWAKPSPPTPTSAA